MGIISQTGIYAIVHRASGDRYIGSTSVGFTQRWNNHRTLLRRGKHGTKRLQNAWSKYSESAFDFVILEDGLTNPETIFEREQCWMDASIESGIVLYNSRPTARSPKGFKHSPETIARMSAAQLARSENISANLRKMWQDPQVRARLEKASSENNKKRWSDPENRKRQSDKAKKRLSSKKARAKLSRDIKASWDNDPDRRARMSQWATERMQDPDIRKSYADRYAKTYPGAIAPDGTIYAPIVNLSAFCREHNLNCGHMGKVMSGVFKQHKGWSKYGL